MAIAENISCNACDTHYTPLFIEMLVGMVPDSSLFARYRPLRHQLHTRVTRKQLHTSRHNAGHCGCTGTHNFPTMQSGNGPVRFVSVMDT